MPEDEYITNAPGLNAEGYALKTPIFGLKFGDR